MMTKYTQIITDGDYFFFFFLKCMLCGYYIPKIETNPRGICSYVVFVVGQSLRGGVELRFNGDYIHLVIREGGCINYCIKNDNISETKIEACLPSSSFWIYLVIIHKLNEEGMP